MFSGSVSWMVVVPALLGSVMIVGAGLWELAQATPVGVTLQPRQWWQAWSPRRRLVLGNLMALPIVTVLLLLGRETAWQWIAWLVGLAIYLLLGWSIPRRPEQQRRELERRLKQLTPSLINHLWIGLSTGEPPVAVLQSYLARPDRKLAPMHAVIRDALTIMELDRILPFAALHQATRVYGCPVLTDTATILMQAEHEGSSPLAALTRLRESVERMVYEEFRTMVERRKLMLLGVTGIAVLAVVGQILFVAVVGGGVLDMI